MERLEYWQKWQVDMERPPAALAWGGDGFTRDHQHSRCEPLRWMPRGFSHVARPSAQHAFLHQ